MRNDPLRRRICSELARLLRRERERRGMSLNLLAARAGLSRQTVSFVEKEQRNPTVDTLLRLTAVLGIKLETLLGRARRAARRKGRIGRA